VRILDDTSDAQQTIVDAIGRPLGFEVVAFRRWNPSSRTGFFLGVSWRFDEE
jgi:hypothetical protein